MQEIIRWADTGHERRIVMKQYIIDSFTDKPFKGNLAAVCVPENKISEETMQKIAMENNLSETAFLESCGDDYNLRWFTPCKEIDFCGHATLAAAFVVMNYLKPAMKTVRFHTKKGLFTVTRNNQNYTMEFPAYKYKKIPVTEAMTSAIGITPKEAYIDRDLLLVLDSEADVINLNPDLNKTAELEGLALAVTAKSTEYDCISRVFAPKLKINEDPVTGSSHCMIAPFWSERLGKKHICACQASARSGVLICDVEGDIVKISGTAVLFSEGAINMEACGR